MKIPLLYDDVENITVQSEEVYESNDVNEEEAADFNTNTTTNAEGASDQEASYESEYEGEYSMVEVGPEQAVD